MANGTIAFDTLQTSGQITGTAKSVDTDYVVNGSARVWIRASDAAVDADSFNVSGTTDNGTGDYSYDFANNMSNSNYCAMGTCISTVPRIASVYGTTTSQFEIRYHNESGSDTNTENSNMVHGDLA